MINNKENENQNETVENIPVQNTVENHNEITTDAPVETVEAKELDTARIKAISISEYAQTEFATFREKPFSAVDSLVLAQLCYMNVTGVVPFLRDDRQPITIQLLYRAECFDQFIEGIFMPGQQRKLIDYVCSSPRFRDIKINYLVRNDDLKKEEQFYAMTFFLPTGETYIGFKGTDDTINGWKEDFNMFYKDTIPGQRSALNYLKAVAAKTKGPIYIGGHSKGGNLSLYAGSFAPVRIQARIVQVFNHDGPGLSKGAKEKKGYTDISNKLNATLPYESVVGLVFSDGNYNVVSSRRVGLLQHDTFAWKIHDGDFIYEKTVKAGANKLMDSIHKLLDKLDVKEREVFVDTLFEIIYSAGATKLSEFPAMALKSRDKVMEKMKNLTPETAELMKSVMGEMIKIIAFKSFELPESEKAKFTEAINKVTATGEKISRKITDTAEKITQTKDKLVADGTAVITGTTEKIVRTKDKIVADSAAAIADTTEKITQTTDKLMADTTAAIADTTEKIVRTKDKLVADSAAVIADTTEKITRKVTGTAEKLARAKNKLAEKLAAGIVKPAEEKTLPEEADRAEESDVNEQKTDIRVEI